MIHDLFVSGAITDSAVENLVLKGTVDGIGAGDAKDVAGFCGLAAEAGALCGPCPDGEQRCVPFEVHQPEARELPDFSLEELATGTWCAGVLVLPIGGTLWRLRRRKATR